MGKVKSFYSYRALFGANAVFNFLVALRGNGKTYGAKLHCIKNWLRDGQEFIYLRRYRSELSSKSTFFTDVAKEFPNLGFRIKGNEGQVTFEPDNDKGEWFTMCYFVALSQAQTKKSMSWPKVTTIIFDEFILEKGMTRYLPSEVEVILNFYSTVDRYQDRTRVLFLANAVSIMNPYFLHFEIDPLDSDKVGTSHDGFIAFHFPDCRAFQQEVEQTRFGKFISGTSYANYAVKSEFRDNSDAQLEEKTSEDVYLVSLETIHGTISIWKRARGGYYAQEKQPKDRVDCTLIRANATEDNRFLESNDVLLQVLRQAYNRGQVTFARPRARNIFLLIFERR